MNKIKMTLMEKANFLRAEMDLDKPIIDWDNVEIIDDKEYQEAKEQNQSKLNLEKELQKEFNQNNMNQTTKADETYRRVLEDMSYLYDNMERMSDYRDLYFLQNYATRIVEKVNELQKEFIQK